ncbi:AsmA-like C-terminal region-containing protein [uncultured Winogradskyella sp.]|uniref:AsmA-like C-terminal region-containing protein n=1 Tax=uncultured Winogradskyella sp. TaxID=395353 RepID=UPI0030EDAFDE
MEKDSKKKTLVGKILKWILAILVFLLASMFAIPSLFNDFISNEIKKGINANLDTELEFKDSEISFFNHFPSLTFSFQDVNLASSEPFKSTSLIKAEEIGFGINVFKLIFSDKVEIKETYISDCNITLIKDKFGRYNYDVYKNADTTTVAQDTSASGLHLKLRRLKIENASVHYQDDDLGITIVSEGLNYNGKGGLDNGKLKLGSKLDIDNVDVVFDHIDYLSGKQLKARSFTIYDTENLSIELDKNTISLNDLDVNFEGKLDVFDDGVAYDILFNTENGTMEALVSALPPKYAEWSKSVSLNGDLDAQLHLAGFSGTVPEASRINQTDLDVAVSDGTIKHKDAAQTIEALNLKFKGRLKNDWIDLQLDNLNFSLNNEKTTGQLHAEGFIDSLYVKSTIVSKINLDILNETLQLPDLNFKGVLTTNINVDGIYQPHNSKLPKTKGFFKLTDGSLQTSGHPEPIKNITLDAVAENPGDTYETSSLVINAFNFSFLDNPFTSSGSFKNFYNLDYSIIGKGDIDFTTLNQVVELPFLIKSGQLRADVNLKGNINQPQTQNTNSGTLALNGIEIETNLLQQPVFIKQGTFTFLNDKMAFSNLAVRHQTSAVELDGYFQNYLNYALYDTGVLRGDLKLKSPKIDITEFFPKEDQLTQQTDSINNTAQVANVVSGVMQVPKDLDLVLNIAIDSLLYNSLTISALKGHLGIKNQGLFLKNSTLNMVDGTAKLDGFYQPKSMTSALFSMAINAQKLNIEKGYNSIALFKELAPAAAQASGIVSVDYKLSGTLDAHMLPILPTLAGKGTLKVHDVKFDGYKLLGKVSEKSGFEALNDPKISEITINSTVSNNVLELERFKFKVRPFKLRVEGQTTLDGELSLKMRIGLPPLGLLGIPVVISGNSENFDVKLGKKSKDLETETTNEATATQEELERLSHQKDAIRTERSTHEIDKMQKDIKSIKSDSLKK